MAPWRPFRSMTCQLVAKVISVAREKPEVARIVVLPVLVDVVDDFLQVQVTAEGRLHHEAVLENITSLGGAGVLWHPDIPVALYSAASASPVRMASSCSRACSLGVELEALTPALDGRHVFSESPSGF